MVVQSWVEPSSPRLNLVGPPGHTQQHLAAEPVASIWFFVSFFWLLAGGGVAALIPHLPHPLLQPLALQSVLFLRLSTEQSLARPTSKPDPESWPWTWTGRGSRRFRKLYSKVRSHLHLSFLPRRYLCVWLCVCG